MFGYLVLEICRNSFSQKYHNSANFSFFVQNRSLQTQPISGYYFFHVLSMLAVVSTKGDFTEVQAMIAAYSVSGSLQDRRSLRRAKLTFPSVCCSNSVWIRDFAADNLIEL